MTEWCEFSKFWWLEIRYYNKRFQSCVPEGCWLRWWYDDIAASIARNFKLLALWMSINKIKQTHCYFRERVNGIIISQVDLGNRFMIRENVIGQSALRSLYWRWHIVNVFNQCLLFLKLLKLSSETFCFSNVKRIIQ